MKKVYFTLLALLSMFVFSCQDEFENENQNLENTITKTSPLVALVSRVSQNRTTFDNIVDNTSCFSLQLPISLTVDSQEFVIQAEADYKYIKEILEESDYDDDVIHFSYPITLVYRNFKSVTVDNKEAFDAILESCGDDQDFLEINCIDFNYPIAINTYDKNNQVANSISILNNSQFINLLDDLKDNDIVSIVYPISMTNSNGHQFTFNNNSELMAGIQNAIGSCDEDETIGSELSDIITKGTWRISYFLEEDEDETYDYYGYNFQFSTNGIVVVTKNTIIINGTWSIGNDMKLNLNFDSTSLEELEEDWVVTELTETTIHLKHQSDDGETHFLTFSKI